MGVWASFGLAMVFLGILVGAAALWDLKQGRAGSGAYQNSLEVEDSSELVSRRHNNWVNLPGASFEEDGLRIRPVPFWIVEQDGSNGQANLPINLYGAHLRTSGDFAISAKLRDIKDRAVLSLYGQVPIIFDEFRYERAALHLTFERGRLLVQVWEDNKQAQTKEFVLENAGSSASRDLEIVRRDGLASFVVDGAQIGSVPEGKLFAAETVWFGAAAETSDWLLASLRAKRLGNSELRIVDISTLDMRHSRSSRQTSGLQELADEYRRGFTLGAAVALGPLVADQEYAQVALVGNFGSFTTENSLKWQFVHPSEHTYDFRETDAIVDIARRHDIKIHGHTLVFGEANARWVQQLPVTTAEEKQRVEEIMLGHINKIVQHYKESISSWDVVNEPLADYDNFQPGTQELRDHIWYRAMGEEYIVKAFRAARQADPHAKLFINEYGLEEDGERWDAFYSLVKRLKEQDVPIDGVGFQSHIYEQADRINPEVLRSHIQELAKLGLESRISEIDVYTADGQSIQASQYSSVLEMCLKEPSCVSYTTWGISDRYNMWRDDDGALQNGQDFLWDRNMEPTPAVEAIRKVLDG